MLSKFKGSLQRLCPEVIRAGGDSRVGIAVSGGVDSMALAYLCSQLRDTHSTSRKRAGPRFRALIVDHRAREGSAVEARAVAKKLRAMRIPATILKLDWKSHHGEDDPSKLPNFETQARKLRYRALGQACRHFRIESLLVAHHEDDQAETVLMRLLGGYTGEGLRGIQESADIPECHGMYGVHASGRVQRRPAWIPMSKATSRIEVAAGGVVIKRPLLGFSKDSLVNLCRDHGVDWFEDPTNRIATLTVRNTIRSLWKGNRMPRALMKSAMLRIAAAKQAQILAEEEQGERLFQSLDCSLDLASGTLTFGSSTAGSPESLPGAALHAAERVASIVTPARTVASTQLAEAAKQIFASELAADDQAQHSTKQTLTTAGIQWQGVEEDNDDILTWRWRLSRQLPSKADALRSCIWTTDGTGEPFWTWQLFDGRYWIRVKHRRRRKLLVQMLQKPQLVQLRKGLNKRERDNLDALLHSHAPGNIRFTLPVIVDGQDGTVLALPTLRWLSHTEMSHLRWDIKYKRLR